MKVLHYGDESLSVAFEEVDANDWGQKVYEPDIVRKALIEAITSGAHQTRTARKGIEALPIPSLRLFWRDSAQRWHS